MTHNKKWDAIIFGQHNPEFTYDDFNLAKKVLRLANKHTQQAVNSCNGVGWIGHYKYYNGTIDAWAQKEHGHYIKSAYTSSDCEETVFDVEMSKIESKITSLIGKKALWKVEFQGDPRGATVKLYYNETFLNNLFNQ